MGALTAAAAAAGASGHEHPTARHLSRPRLAPEPARAPNAGNVHHGMYKDVKTAALAVSIAKSDVKIGRKSGEAKSIIERSALYSRLMLESGNESEANDGEDEEEGEW